MMMKKKLLDAVKAVFKSNKIKYQNKKIVRAWLSEQEAAEYWYVTDDDSFWAKFWKKIKTSFGEGQAHQETEKRVMVSIQR